MRLDNLAQVQLSVSNFQESLVPIWSKFQGRLRFWNGENIHEEMEITKKPTMNWNG